MSTEERREGRGKEGEGGGKGGINLSGRQEGVGSRERVSLQVEEEEEEEEEEEKVEEEEEEEGGRRRRRW